MKLLLIFALLVGGAPSFGQEARFSAETAERHAFEIVTAFQFAAVAADFESTQAALAIPGVYETNPLYGRHPSRLRMYATALPMHAGLAWAGFKLKHADNRVLRRLWFVPQLAFAAAHARAAWGNARLVGRY